VPLPASTEAKELYAQRARRGEPLFPAPEIADDDARAIQLDHTLSGKNGSLLRRKTVQIRPLGVLPGSFPARLVVLRRRMGLSQRKLADKARMKKRTVERLELGQIRNPHVGTVVKLAAALDVTIEVLWLGNAQESGSRSQEAGVRGQDAGIPDSCLLSPDSCLLSPDP